jgi:hypothetical protein
MPLCPTATTNEGHVPGRHAASRGMSSRADQGRACPGPAGGNEVVAAKLGRVETPFADKTVSRWTLQRPGT